jgi:hypothetical protein
MRKVAIQAIASGYRQEIAKRFPCDENDACAALCAGRCGRGATPSERCLAVGCEGTGAAWEGGDAIAVGRHVTLDFGDVHALVPAVEVDGVAAGGWLVGGADGDGGAAEECDGVGEDARCGHGSLRKGDGRVLPKLTHRSAAGSYAKIMG